MTKLFGKFSLEYCDLQTMLWNIDILLRLLTIKANRKFNKPIPWIYYVITITTGLCYFYSYMFSTVWFVLVRCKETGDFINAMVSLSLSMCSVTCIPKIFFMKYSRKTVMDLIDEYLNFNELIAKGTRFEKNFFANMRTIKMQATVSWFVLTLNGAVFATLPFLRPGRHLTQDTYVMYGLDPMLESPNYEIASMLTILSVYFSVTIMVHITVFIIVIVGFLESQMLALSLELANIWEDSKKFYNYYILLHSESVGEHKVRNIFIKTRLRDILILHMMNVGLQNKVEKELRFIFMTDFMFMIFALVTELVGGLENTMIQLPFTFGMVFIDCYIGQRLIDASITFERAIYGCKWENFNVSNQKTVLFMLQCSQKTMILTAGGIAILNFIYLMSVLKSTYSAYTTLKTSA